MGGKESCVVLLGEENRDRINQLQQNESRGEKVAMAE